MNKQCPNPFAIEQRPKISPQNLLLYVKITFRYTVPSSDSQCFHLTTLEFFEHNMAIDYQELVQCEHVLSGSLSKSGPLHFGSEKSFPSNFSQ